MVRCGGEIENGDFDKGKKGMLDFFGMYLLLRNKAIGLLKNFGERYQNSSFTANKYIWIGHITANSVLPFASLIKCQVQIIKEAYFRSKRFTSPQKAIK